MCTEKEEEIMDKSYICANKNCAKFSIIAIIAIIAAFFFFAPEFSAKAKKIKKPGKPVLKSAKVSAYNNLTVKWKGAKNATAYQIRYAAAKKKNKKWVKAGGWKTVTVGKKARSKKLKLGFSKNYIVQIRAKRAYKHTYIDYGDFFFYGQKRTKIKYKYGKCSNKKHFRTGRKNTKIRLAEKKKWNECKKKGKKYNYNYEPKVQPGKSVYYYLQVTKGKYGQKIKKVKGDSGLKVTKVKKNLYKATVAKNMPECRLMIEAKTATSIASSDIYVPEKKTTSEQNDPLLSDHESEEEYVHYWNLSDPYYTYDAKNCAQCRIFVNELNSRIKDIVNSNPHNTNIEKVIILKIVGDMAGTYPYFRDAATDEKYSNCNDKYAGTVACQDGAACIIKAAKLMGISDDKIWAQDGFAPNAHKTKLQNYKKCVINDHCGVCIKLGAFKYRFDAQGFVLYDDGTFEPRRCKTNAFIDYEGKTPTETFLFITLEGERQLSYWDDDEKCRIAFSKSDYYAEKQEHPTWTTIKAYWNDDQTKIIHVTDGQNP